LRKIISFKIPLKSNKKMDAHIDFQNLTDVSRPGVGQADVIFLHFKGSKVPTYVIKFSKNPYTEYIGTKIFESLGLPVPKIKLSESSGKEFQTFVRTLYSKSKTETEESKRLYSAFKYYEEYKKLADHFLIMDYQEGNSLSDEVYNDDLFSENDETYESLGKALIADAFILNGDRFETLFAPNIGNFKLSDTVSGGVIYIDQATDALRDQYPTLFSETLIMKFNMITNLLFPTEKLKFEGSTLNSFDSGDNTSLEDSLPEDTSNEETYSLDGDVNFDTISISKENDVHFIDSLIDQYYKKDERTEKLYSELAFDNNIDYSMNLENLYTNLQDTLRLRKAKNPTEEQIKKENQQKKLFFNGMRKMINILSKKSISEFSELLRDIPQNKHALLEPSFKYLTMNISTCKKITSKSTLDETPTKSPIGVDDKRLL
jgi:hypothetical protein